MVFVFRKSTGNTQNRLSPAFKSIIFAIKFLTLKKFKTRWEIQHNWQLLFPFLGAAGLAYSAYKLSHAFIPEQHIALKTGLAAVFYMLLYKITLFLFKKLEHKWVVQYKWEMIRIFIVFAVTGSSSAWIGRPVIHLLGITRENIGAFWYWTLFIVIGLVFYQILLVTFGWLFGQFRFFWAFEKKMLSRMGLGFLFGRE